MRLNSLLERAGIPQLEIAGLAVDSRQVRSDFAFVAYKGSVFDGHDFVCEAARNGATCVIAERRIAVPEGIVLVVAPDIVAKRNALAAKLYGEPSQYMRCVGVTGTNGKTSVCYALASTLPKTGFCGSLGTGMLPNLTETGLTTVDGVLIQSELTKLRDQGARRVALEVSSRALDQCRITHVQLEVGVFTNLTRDHLDYHQTMARYGAAKRRLFTEFDIKSAIINADDMFGRELIVDCKNRGISTIAYGSKSHADISWHDVSYSTRGASGFWHTKWGDAPLRVPVRSDFGLANAAAVLGTFVHFGYDIEDAAYSLSRMSQPPGRLEFFGCENSPQVIVDFAHSPDALQRTLRAVRKLDPATLICVFGCGGDRDSGKRQEMGAIANELADRCIVTTDNPRSEDPQAIANEILEGIPRDQPVEVILDRKTAIDAAISSARRGDLVVIAGKGAESYQEIGAEKIPFSDRNIVQKVLSRE